MTRVMFNMRRRRAKALPQPYYDSENMVTGKSKFFSEGMFLYRGFSLLQSEHPLLQSEHPLFLRVSGLFFKTLFVKVEAF